MAILRGLTAVRAAEVGHALYASGFRLLEVPLNREGALDAVAELVKTLPADAWIGAGTVLQTSQVAEVAGIGGRMIISANTNPMVVAAAHARGLWSLPGVATPTEAFAALEAGAHALKVFPAELISPQVLGAWRSVLPSDVSLYPVGGIHAQNMAAYRAVGARGVGLGGALFKPELSLQEISARARSLAHAWHGAATVAA